MQIKTALDEVMEKLPELFPLHEVMAKVPPEERTPYVIVAFQECERMNALVAEMRRSLRELDLGLKVSLWHAFETQTLASIIRLISPRSSSCCLPPALCLQWYSGLNDNFADVLKRDQLNNNVVYTTNSRRLSMNV